MQNLNYPDQTHPILTAKAYIKQILDQLLIDYQNIRLEREKMSEWEENQDLSILGIIEVLTDEIRGYAFQVTTNNLLKEPQEIINQLKSLKIFDIPELRIWYVSCEQNYPQIKRYLETLNYLRLLIIEYLHS